MSSGFFSSIFGGKLALFSGLSLAAVATSAIPVSLVTWSAEDRNINNSISEAIKSVNNHLSNSSQQLTQEYKGRGNDVAEAANIQTLNNVTDTWSKGNEVAKPIYGYIHENAAEINYYSFVLGNLIKSSLSSLPVTIRDTIVYDNQTKLDQQLLSVQKMMAIGNMNSFKEFVAKMIWLVQRHHVTLRTMTTEDGKGLINIFREIREDDFEQFMKRVNKNIEKMQMRDDDDRTYTNATQLLQDAFVGESEITNLPQQIKELCQKIEKQKGRLAKEIKGLDEVKIANLQEILKKLLVDASANKKIPPS